MSEHQKLYIPKRLYNRLKSIYSEKLTILCAPENYGKTTLLREFIRRSRPAYRSCHFIGDNHYSANECFARYCELLLGNKEQIPITESDFIRLRDKFDSAQCDKVPVFIIDTPSATEMILNNLYCFRLITIYSPASTIMSCEGLTFYHQMLVEHNDINLIDRNELSLTIEETDDYLKSYGITDADAALINRKTKGEMLRTKLSAELLVRGEVPESYGLFSLLYNSVIKLLPRHARFAALCVCAFNSVDEQTCQDMLSEPDIVEFYGSDNITLSAITDGIEKINLALPNLWVNSKSRNYSPPEFARKAVLKGFEKLPDKTRSAFLRCCAKDSLRCGKVFTAICQYCVAGEYETAATLPVQGIVALDYILTHKQSIYEIVTNITLTCKPMIPRLVRMVAMLMLTDYKERTRYLFRDIIAHISTSDDYTESERNNVLCYTHALRMYEEFYLIEKMGAHIKCAYELFSRSTEYDPPFYSWSLYTPSIFSLLYQYSVPTSTQFEQFTRYHRMYTEMVRHGEYIEAVYTAEMHYYMGDLRKSLTQSLEVTQLCTAEKSIPTGLIAYKTAAKCALLMGNCEQYNEIVGKISDIVKRYSSTEVGDMALLTLGMLSCLKHGNDEDIWHVISQNDEIIDHNRYTAPFSYYIRSCYMLAHDEHELLMQQSPKYIRAAAEVRNETVEIMLRLIIATSDFIRQRTNDAVKNYVKVVEMLGSTEMIMPVVEHCVNYPMIFRYAAKTLKGQYAALAKKILDIAKPCIENIETLRTQELTEQELARRHSARIAESESRQSAINTEKRKELKLTKKALQYAMLAADGFSNSEISEMTGASADSIKSSLKRTFSKLGVSSRAKLKSVLSDIT